MTQEELKRQQELLEQAAKAKKDAIDFSANEEITNIEQEHTANVKDIDAQYNDIIDISNVQKLINEKQVSEAMANAGLSDSGLNRTQQTAIQLSHSNAVSEAKIARQKSVDALALAMRQKISSIKSNQEASKANVDSELAEGNQKLIDTYDSQVKADFKTKNDLITSLNNPEKTTNEKMGLLSNYIGQYGADSTFGTYAKSYYDEVMQDTNASAETKNAATKLYVGTMGANAVEGLMANNDLDSINSLINKFYSEDNNAELFAVFDKVNESGSFKIEDGFAVRTAQAPTNANGQEPNVEPEPNNSTDNKVYGIAKSSVDNGDNIHTQQINDLERAFNEGGITRYAIVKGELAKQGYNTYQMDKHMKTKYGAFWILTTALAGNLDYEKGGYVRGKDDNINLFGLDANAKYTIDGIEYTIGQIRSKAIKAGVDRKIMREVLNKYGVNEGK